MAQPFAMQIYKFKPKQKKKPRKGQKRVRQKEDPKILVFQVSIPLGRMGLRRVQREQIETNSSFSRAVAELFNVKSKGEKEELRFNIPLAK